MAVGSVAAPLLYASEDRIPIIELLNGRSGIDNGARGVFLFFCLGLPLTGGTIRRNAGRELDHLSRRRYVVHGRQITCPYFLTLDKSRSATLFFSARSLMALSHVLCCTRDEDVN